MPRAISLAKYRKAKRALALALGDLDSARRDGLAACAANPRARALDDSRALAVRNYCGARRWVSHWRGVLAESAPRKFANQFAWATS